MPVVVSEIKLSPDEPEEAALRRAASLFGKKPEELSLCGVSKVSVDARHKDNVRLVYSVALDFGGAKGAAEALRSGNVRFYEQAVEAIPQLPKEPEYRPVIIGFGPAGMFAGLYLARAGARPLILERGAAVEERAAAVERYWQGGPLDENASVQFGEGGAGTFSDGKLTTRIGDPRCGFVLREFAAHGAPEDVMIRAKPHVGTDRLREVVKKIRQEILSLGGEVRFLTKAEDFEIAEGNIHAVIVSGECIPARQVILAAGHSARETFAMLKSKPLLMEAKPFSAGFRIEHLRADIDRAQYGEFAGHPALGAADYQLSAEIGGRCAYTFCMCPGGFVVPAENEKETIVTNGMSMHARNGMNSNAALVCSLSAEDFGGDPFRAMAFQEKTERLAFALGKGKAPAETVGAFLSGEKSGFGRVMPTYSRGVAETDLTALYPEEMTSVLRAGIHAFHNRIRCFDDPEAVLTGPETRTSSPVRIVRDGESLEAVGAAGLYPCGEGAGYAGGIMSAAADGLRCAEKVLEALMK